MVLQVIADDERVAKYGRCEFCGAPRDSFEVEFNDGSKVLTLACLNGHEAT